MTKLSVNVNKIALLRNSRGENLPNLLQLTQDIIKFGADGITVHPRPDERHITENDVLTLSQNINVEFNVEGFPNERYFQLINKSKPAQCTLVPDPPGALTSNTGWDIKKNLDYLEKIVAKLHEMNCRVSIFLNPKPELIPFAAETGTDRIELYTGDYAENYAENREKAIEDFVKTAEEANKHNLGINAGHDLNLENLQYFAENIPNLLEVSIGHALISDALYIGYEEAIHRYKNCL